MRPPLLHSRFKQIDSEGYSFVTGLEGFKEWRIYRYLQIFTDIYRIRFTDIYRIYLQNKIYRYLQNIFTE